MRLSQGLLWLTALLLCPLGYAEEVDGTTAQVELRILGKSKAVLLPVDKVSTIRSGKNRSAGGSDEIVFAGLVLSITPSIQESGAITYSGEATLSRYLGLNQDQDGSWQLDVRKQTVAFAGEVGNHQSFVLNFPELKQNRYIALGDVSRPKKDCPGCGPRDKEELAKQEGS
ncbi:MAG: hypothetical protein AAGA45_02860 [Verrucomicrobiota bacterium]